MLFRFMEIVFVYLSRRALERFRWTNRIVVVSFANAVSIHRPVVYMVCEQIRSSQDTVYSCTSLQRVIFVCAVVHSTDNYTTDGVVSFNYILR